MTASALIPSGDDFLAGNLVQQYQLNRISYDVDALCQIMAGKPAATGIGAKPVCKVLLSGSITVASGAGGTTQIVSWGQALYDTDGMFDAASNDHLTVKTPGWYRIFAGASWASAAAASERVVQILVNGTGDPTNVTSSDNTVLAAAQAYRHQCVAYEHLEAGAAIYCGVWQDTGAGLSLRQSGNYGTWLTAVWDAPY